MSVLNDNFLTLSQNTNRFLVYVGIKLQIFYLTINNFTN